MPSQKPPLQLVPGDKFNLTLGVLGCIGLASCKDAKSLHPFVRWSCNAYTNWNLAFILLGTLTGQKQWEPFLLVNSVGIFLGFRTAFCQGLDENMRKKVRDLGLDLTRARFLFADHMCHTAPVIALLYALVKRKQRIHPMNSIYAIILSTWFSFRQSAQLDASDLYVPHPWKRAWGAIFTGIALSPPLVDALIRRKHGKAALCVLGLAMPWLLAKLDPELRSKYNFECKLSEAKALAEARAEAKRVVVRHRNGNTTMPRAQSELLMKDPKTP